MSDTDDIVEALRKRCHDLGNAIQVEREARKVFETSVVGHNGDNGKIGTLRGQLAMLRAALVAVALAALGGLGTAIASVYSAGEERGGERARLEAVERQTLENTAAIKTATIWLEVFRLSRQGDQQ